MEGALELNLNIYLRLAMFMSNYSAVFTTNAATTTAWTTHISSPLVRTSALVRISNDIFGGSDIYLYSTSDYCSIRVPGTAQAIASVSVLETTSPSPDCQQRFQLSQTDSSNTFQLCRCAHTCESPVLYCTVSVCLSACAELSPIWCT